MVHKGSSMEAIKQEINIPENHHLKLDLNIPDSFPPGKAEIFFIIQSKKDTLKSSKRILGSMRGKVKMSDDFNDPLPDNFWVGGK